MGKSGVLRDPPRRDPSWGFRFSVLFPPLGAAGSGDPPCGQEADIQDTLFQRVQDAPPPTGFSSLVEKMKYMSKQCLSALGRTMGHQAPPHPLPPSSLSELSSYSGSDLRRVPPGFRYPPPPQPPFLVWPHTHIYGLMGLTLHGSAVLSRLPRAGGPRWGGFGLGGPLPPPFRIQCRASLQLQYPEDFGDEIG